VDDYECKLWVIKNKPIMEKINSLLQEINPPENTDMSRCTGKKGDEHDHWPNIILFGMCWKCGIGVKNGRAL